MIFSLKESFIKIGRVFLFILTLFFLLGTCYPFIVTLFATFFLKEKSKGSLIINTEGHVIGSRLLGQPFKEDKYFQGFKTD
jgi:K+-transporting ATPase ATPase C chain